MSRGEIVLPRRFPWAALVFGAVVFTVLVGLGTWQVQRLVRKEQLIEAIDQRIHSAPRPLADLETYFSVAGEADYMPVTLTGRFLHDRESHFFATQQGETGFYVYTPLMLADGRAVLINRGFVPYDRKDPAKRAAGQIDGPVEIVGLARDRLAEKPSSLVPDNDAAKNIFYWKDLDAMAAHAGLDRAAVLPFFVDAGDTPNPGGLPVGGVTIVDLPNDHLQYAITWYGLAAALAGVLGAWLWRRRTGVVEDR